MPIVLKSRREIEMMRRAGQVGCHILAKMRSAVAAGITTAALDEIARNELNAAGAVSLSLHYTPRGYQKGKGYPAYTCISVNDEVVHGIPGSRALRDGDVVTLDLALSLDGYCADTATTVPVGAVKPDVQRLLSVTRDTLALAIANIRPDRRWSEIARLMQANVEKAGFGVVREFVGHGIGQSMHEDPKVPNFVTAEQLRSDFRLRPGMTLAVEPMVVMGHRDVKQLSDGWTIVTEDGMPAAHFEHTVAVTETGVDILTDGRGPNTNL